MSDIPGSNSGLSFLKETASGVVISALVKPRSRRDMIEGVNPEGLLKISVSAPPVKGAANKGLVKLLSKSLGVPKSRLSIISGETSSRKRVLIQDMTAEAAERWWRNTAGKTKAKSS